ncbi:Putative uncharacterized protein [Lactococcus lactis subsp. lactis A12]|uniref:Uncharacterized protein n=1 Tax=Lactococcus lactis subsp. lactis A12 TaxID=1137134 RepID=S6FVG0_LACLL|nr:Putative uncharacterized protein [Lactococcus lactis subsp. lactis A12]
MAQNDKTGGAAVHKVKTASAIFLFV